MTRHENSRESTKTYFPGLACGNFYLVALCHLHPFEPRYQGKRLAAWAADLPEPEELRDMQPTPAALAKQDQAIAAIRHFGIKAMPLAIKWCGMEDSMLKERLKDLVNGQKIFQIQIPSDYDYQNQGVRIFEVLGPIAKPAIPTLINLFHKQRSYTFSTVSSALHYIGTDTIPPLIEALTSSNERVRAGAAMTLGGFESQARDAAPALMQCLKDENPQVRSAAAMSLARLGGDTNAAISALLPCLEDKDVGVRQMAALSLGYIHQYPNQVVPALFAAIGAETNGAAILTITMYMIPAIGRFGTNARPWSPILVQWAESNRFSYWTGSVRSALIKIDPEVGRPLIDKYNAGVSNRVKQAQLEYAEKQRRKALAVTNAPSTNQNSLKTYASTYPHAGDEPLVSVEI